jgi:hypothetical protein
MQYKLATIAVVLPLALFLTWVQHRRLTSAGVSQAFLRRLAAVSSLALIATLAFFASGLSLAFQTANVS